MTFWRGGTTTTYSAGLPSPRDCLGGAGFYSVTTGGWVITGRVITGRVTSGILGC